MGASAFSPFSFESPCFHGFSIVSFSLIHVMCFFLPTTSCSRLVLSSGFVISFAFPSALRYDACCLELRFYLNSFFTLAKAVSKTCEPYRLVCSPAGALLRRLAPGRVSVALFRDHVSCFFGFITRFHLYRPLKFQELLSFSKKFCEKIFTLLLNAHFTSSAPVSALPTQGLVLC